MDLPDFLLARIAEDEEVARRAAFGYGAGWTNETDDVEDWSVVHADGKRDMVGCEDRDVTGHIARHDPARVLAECDAKRRIVESCTWVREERCQVRPGVYEYRPVREPRYGDGPEWDILRLLALPYADHPDYRPEWRP